ncbi:ATPase [Coraliomargarita sinensis]|uniref:ATPase n=1 Tax=Coraliomargarita sinensis TaxID=2174842 RepID=A0A317ZE95_9BACT|nr:ATP-binding protein [Coraliomargarita sinensis]PXA03725.1 ATPase [Coraliomargarita sinensis]
MLIPKNELISVLQEFNPWWSGQVQADLPEWERTASQEIARWCEHQKSKRSLLLTGPRQVGKTTLFRQTIRNLLQSGIAPSQILYATFDHPLLKLAGMNKTIEAWEEIFPGTSDHPQFLFLDEVQFIPDWQVWLKHQVDFGKNRKIAITGSASPLRSGSSESGVGRWETIKLPTLTFREFLKLRQVEVPEMAEVSSLKQLIEHSPSDILQFQSGAKQLTPYFHDYLLRGGFPEPALEEDLQRCQRLLREDIVDKVLKRDMTALYGVRRIVEIEKIFLYLCYHDGGVLDISAISKELDGVKRHLLTDHLDLLEAAHLIYSLKPFGYGKEVLRGKSKVYLADAAIPGSILLYGQKLLEKPDRLGNAVETAFFKHVFTRYYHDQPTFSYWQSKGRKTYEVDLVAEIGERIVPFEVKYQDKLISDSDLKGLRLFMEEKSIDLGYVITRNAESLFITQPRSAKTGQYKEKLDAHIVGVPACLACYWLS